MGLSASAALPGELRAEFCVLTRSLLSLRMVLCSLPHPPLPPRAVSRLCLRLLPSLTLLRGEWSSRPPLTTASPSVAPGCALGSTCGARGLPVGLLLTLCTGCHVTHLCPRLPYAELLGPYLQDQRPVVMAWSTGGGMAVTPAHALGHDLHGPSDRRPLGAPPGPSPSSGGFLWHPDQNKRRTELPEVLKPNPSETGRKIRARGDDLPATLNTSLL